MSGIITPKERAQAREAILKAGVLRLYLGHVVFASGQRANNHLSMEELPESGPKADAVLSPMGKIIRHYRPDVLVGVPRGGQNWALLLSNREDVPVAELEVEDKKLKIFRYASTASRLLVARATTIVVIEDATSRRTNEAGMYSSLPSIRKKVVACVTGWARASATERINNDDMPPLIAVVDEIIPYHLTPEDLLYEHAILTNPEHT